MQTYIETRMVSQGEYEYEYEETGIQKVMGKVMTRTGRYI